ncbi:ComEC/Rec2 family competence protein [Actinorugispora endophytica]|uniref:Competence protein ComEC n=1 Tax=Actinorugispora endophytica TaxID=1605990 RepID=A0A4R6UXT6_9ACTN|nr:ComEC/Rec2 family competence protein [Actinorugispora endophytica]TDQ52078.1 competence protein ComEC [Actinorugispora endophytica]
MSLLGTDAPGERVPLDLRLCAPAVGTWLAALALLGVPADAALAGAAVLGVLALAAFLPLRRGVRFEGAVALVAATLVCAAGGALAVAGRSAAVADSPVTALAEAEGRARLVVRLSLDPRPRAAPTVPGRPEFVVAARTEWVDVDGRQVRTRVPVVLLVHGEEWRHLVPSQPVLLDGRLVPAGDGGLEAALVLVRGPPAGVGPPTAAHAWAGGVRARLRQACAVLPQPERGLLPALVVGDVSGLDEEAAEDFRATGMTHLLTVSGTNLSVMTGVVLGAARWFRAPPWCPVALGTVVIAVFVLVARPEPSVLRAAFMGAIALLALALGRPSVGVAALSASVIGLLLFSPGLAASYGFALSVLATAGILVLAPRWRDAWSARVPVWLAEAVAVALAAQVACAPVLVVLSAEVSWVSVPANVLAGPFVPVATVGGFAVAGLALVAMPAAQVAVWVPGTAVALVRAVAGAGARVPQGALPWRADLAGALLLAVLIAALLALRGRVRRAVAAVSGAVAGTVLVVSCVAPGWPPGDWAVVACDVGQGDALVLSAGPGRAVVVDAGIDPRAVDLCLDDLGVREVVLLVLTHHDSDHAGGAPGVLRGRGVGAVLVPPGFDAPETLEALADAGAVPDTATAGRRYAVGPWRLSVLWPRRGFAGDPNEGSVVLLASWSPPPDAAAEPLSVLLTGDIEESAQRGLLSEPGIRDVDVLKTPHHGAGTQEPAFLAATRPRVTLTSVGADNPYGHPAPRTWALLTGLTPASYRTDLHGDVAVSPGPDGPSVRWRGPDAR